MRKRKPIPSREFLNSILWYIPETGRLYWKYRPVEMFSDGGHKAEHTWAAWNKKNAGKEAFTATNQNGYRVGAICRNVVLAHRVIWMMAYGYVPEILDHINGDPSDNRLPNLREATQHINMRNARMSRRNASGTTGVAWHKQVGRWRAYITVDGRQRSLGLFDTVEDATAARKSAEAEAGYHENHGRAA